jgi:hypothetical protein
LTRITTTEHVLQLLRIRLQQVKKSRAKESAAAAPRTQARPAPVERLAEIAAANALSDAETEHALISGLLTEEFGAAAENDPKFQELVADVRRIIASDDGARHILKQAIAQLKNG